MPGPLPDQAPPANAAGSPVDPGGLPDPAALPDSAALPDPEMLPGSDVVIYDGHCQFCRGAVGSLRRFDGRGQRLSFLSLHDPRVARWAPGLSHDALMDQMYVVEPDGTTHGGADAVRYLSRRLPSLWWSAPILHVPGTAGLWRWLYRQVARQRYRLAGKSCDSGSCRLH